MPVVSVVIPTYRRPHSLVIDHLRPHDWRAAMRHLLAWRHYDLRDPVYFVAYLIQLKWMGLDRRFVP